MFIWLVIELELLIGNKLYHNCIILYVVFQNIMKYVCFIKNKKLNEIGLTRIQKKSLNDYFIIQNSKFSKWYVQRIFFKQTKIDLDSNETSQL